MKNRCSVDGCNNKTRGPNTPYCEAHYMRLRRRGCTDRHEPAERLIHTGGYVLIYAPEHDLTKRHSGSYEYEHRVVYYNHNGNGPFNCHWCGKEVTWDDMHVDHLNAMVTDNGINNLVASCPVCNQLRGRDKMVKTMREKHGTWIEFNNQRRMLQDWARIIGISRSALQYRLAAGWPTEMALTTPKRCAGV